MVKSKQTIACVIDTECCYKNAKPFDKPNGLVYHFGAVFGNLEQTHSFHVREMDYYVKEVIQDIENFFFKTKEIDLTWTQFKQDVNYLPKFRPSGNVYRVKEDRLSKFDGVDGYVAHLLGGSYAIEVPDYSTVQEPDPDTEYAEGERKVRESYFFTRNPQLVADAKKANRGKAK